MDGENTEVNKMYGLMKIVTLNGGRYIGLPIHIARHVPEATKYKLALAAENQIEMTVIDKSEFKRPSCTTVRNRTTYDDQRWFRIPTAITRTLNDDLYAVGKQMLVRFDPTTMALSLEATGRDA
jgi:hypothetical protein